MSKAGASRAITRFASAFILLAMSCQNPVGPLPDSAKSALIGKWYAQLQLYTGGPSEIMAIDFTNDTVEFSFLNCGQEIRYLSASYSLAANVVTTKVSVDSAAQNALQLFVALSFAGSSVARAEFYQDSLIFDVQDENSPFEALRYTRNIPQLTGAAIHGTLNYNGNFSDGFFRVYAWSSDQQVSIAFSDHPGSFCLQGLPQGVWAISARYFSKQAVLRLASIPSDSLSLEQFYATIPQGYYAEAVQLSGKPVEGIAIVIDTIAGMPKLKTFQRCANQEYSPASCWHRLAF